MTDYSYVFVFLFGFVLNWLSEGAFMLGLFLRRKLDMRNKL